MANDRGAPVGVSVIMGIYNDQLEEEQLDAAVQSVLDQTYEDFEFIIYDDGSVPEVSDHILSLGMRDERIIVTGSRYNNGLGFSLNRCIELARGKYIARMDADDESLPERFKKQIEFLENNPQYSWCGTNALLFDDQGEWEHTTRPEIPRIEDFYRFSPYIHPSVMYRANLFYGEEDADADRKKENYYSEIREALRCEDYEIFMRLMQMGYLGYNLQEELFRYRVDRSNYHKRSLGDCVNEAKIRYRSFERMGLGLPEKLIYSARPVVSFFVPRWMAKLLKRRRKEL